MFALGIRHLMGIFVATNTSRREPPEEPEWPLHPARVMMAIAAAYFETDRDTNERKVIEWLESLEPPQIFAPLAAARTPVTRYVAVNDKLTMPEQRPRQARTFPTMVMESDQHDSTFLVWHGVEIPNKLRNPAQNLLGKVTRIGHSSSVVQVWLEEDESVIEKLGVDAAVDHWTSDPAATSASNATTMRVATIDMLKGLIRDYNEEAIEAYSDLQQKITKSGGADKKRLKAELLKHFGDSEPTVRRPQIRTTARYSRTSRIAPNHLTTVFDEQLLILARHESHSLGLESTLQLSSALRRTILSMFGENKIPEWISGHQPDGTPSESTHLAIISLPFVTAKYADGHLTGMALVFPRDVVPRERGNGLKDLLYDLDGKPKSIELKLGRAGVWNLVRDEAATPPFALRSSTWTGMPDPRNPSNQRRCDTWASVTPIVLDRFPKKNRRSQRKAWREEVVQTIARSCTNIGLPEPIEVDFDASSWHRGVPVSIPERGGFPLITCGPGKPARFQVHARIRFAQPVIGPVIVGAGRYVGYGLCKPLRSDDRVQAEVWNRFPIAAKGGA